MKKMKIYSLKKMLLLLFVSGWVIPVIVIFICMTISYRQGIIQKTEILLKDELKLFTTLTAFKLDEVISTSKDISYDKNIEKLWHEYSKGKIDKAKFYKGTTDILKVKFYTNSSVNAYAFYLEDDPSQLYPNTYENSIYITEDVIEKAKVITEEEDSPAPHVVVIDGNIYIIRNMYTVSGYTKYGTVILCVNSKSMFAEISQDNIYDMSFFINESNSRVLNNNGTEDGLEDLLSHVEGMYSTKNKHKITIISDNKNKYEAYLNEQRYKDYHIGAVLIVETRKVYGELEILNKMIFSILTFLIPVIIFVFYFIARNITTPIGRMIEGAKNLEKGDLGMKLEEPRMPNKEFEYLRESFNKMSLELKYLFDYAYNEKLARKDAKILALQSQINPHFLNNTLEMMNWQARMAGDIEVSKMIGALSTLLDYSMDRSNKRLINLSDEIRCAEAYFYIISMRFGKRLTVHREIDESLLTLQVPQLILQPLLENAVVHGVESVNRGTIWLKAFKKDDNVVLQVINTGKPMTKEQEEKIENLMNGTLEKDPEGKGKHISLGIRNVNERIKLIFGMEYGLTIKSIENGDTAATIIIPFEAKGGFEKENLLKNILEMSK